MENNIDLSDIDLIYKECHYEDSGIFEVWYKAHPIYLIENFIPHDIDDLNSFYTIEFTSTDDYLLYFFDNTERTFTREDVIFKGSLKDVNTYIRNHFKENKIAEKLKGFEIYGE